jgi:hypothetical protein
MYSLLLFLLVLLFVYLLLPRADVAVASVGAIERATSQHANVSSNSHATSHATSQATSQHSTSHATSQYANVRTDVNTRSQYVQPDFKTQTTMSTHSAQPLKSAVKSRRISSHVQFGGMKEVAVYSKETGAIKEQRIEPIAN